jgi:hypothetical protein
MVAGTAGTAGTGEFSFGRKSCKLSTVGAWFTIEFWLLALVSTWMTASAIIALRGRVQHDEQMNNLYEQVLGAVRVGDLPRAILILEGEPGPLAKLLSSILTEATRFTPKLRVAYKITLESIKRHGQIALSPLRGASLIAPAIGVLGFLGPLTVLMIGNTPSWMHALWLLLLSVVISAIAYMLHSFASRAGRESAEVAGDLGRKLLNYLLSPESPLPSLRGQSFTE